MEVTNRELEVIITKIVSIHKNDWAMKLFEAVWAYKTTWKTTTGITPFHVVYGKSAMMLVEFEHKTLRIVFELNLDLTTTQPEKILTLNGLDEWRKSALHNTEMVQQKWKQ